MEGLKRSTRNLFSLHPTCQALVVGLAPPGEGEGGSSLFRLASRTGCQESMSKPPIRLPRDAIAHSADTPLNYVVGSKPPGRPFEHQLHVPCKQSWNSERSLKVRRHETVRLMSSVIPSEKKSCSGSALRLMKGKT